MIQESRKHRSVLWGLLLACVAVCAGCRPAETGGEARLVYDTFPQTVSLTSQEIRQDSVLLRYPFRLRVQGDRAAVLDYHQGTYFYYLFTYPDFRFLASFGRKGQGPGETLSGDDLQWRDSVLWTLDSRKKCFQLFRSQADSVALIGETKVEATLRPLSFVFSDDSTLWIPDYSGEHRLLRLTPRGDITARVGTIPVADTTAVVSKAALAQAWRSFPAYNPRNKVLAMATQLGEVIEIYHTDHPDSPIVVQGPNGEPQFQLRDGYAIPSGIMGFSDVQVGDDCIYAIFQGRTFKDIAAGKSKLSGGSLIYVFTLDGQPKLCYQLDCPISGFYVDEQARRIVGLNVNSDQQFVVFEF